MKLIAQSWLVLWSGCFLAIADLTAAEKLPVWAPHKFIPTYAIKYGGSEGWPSLEEAARFDILIVSACLTHTRALASPEGNTWQRLKKRNPYIQIFLYQNGPAMYDTSHYGQLGEGWQWLCREHGPHSADRWVAVGRRYGGPLQGARYPNERLMNLGNPRWRQYWLEQTTAKFWAGKDPIGFGADGIFADNCQYQMPWLGDWHLESQPNKKDEPTDYFSDGRYQAALFHQHTRQFLLEAVPWLQKRGYLLVLNFGYMGQQPEYWQDLDQLPQTVFAAMEEGAFVHPWGPEGEKGNFVFVPEAMWLRQVQTMARLRRVRALMNIHGPVLSQHQDIRRMDAADASGRRAWDILWYAICSFLQSYDPQRQNAAMNFTVWGYSRFYWLDEFDPRYLHLGRAVGSMYRHEGKEGYVYLREFEDGWAAVNPTSKNAQHLPIPKGRARIISHEHLKNPKAVPLTKHFDLPAHRGVILLKEGRQLGNQDN